MATAKKKAAPAKKGEWTPPWAKKEAGKKAMPKKSMGGKMTTPKKGMGGKMKGAC